MVYPVGMLRFRGAMAARNSIMMATTTNFKMMSTSVRLLHAATRSTSLLRMPNAMQPAIVRHSNKTMRLQRPQRHSYYGSSGHVESSGENLVLTLITINAGVAFLWQIADTPAKHNGMVAFFTTSAAHLHHGLYHTLLTSMFSHAVFGHFLTTMVGLSLFGREMCRVLGTKRFLGLYVGSGILSSLAAVYEQTLSHRHFLNLGANGPVNSIAVLSILYFRNSKLVLLGLVPMRAWVVGSLYLGWDLYGWISNQRDGIGPVANLSGAFCGGAYYYLRKAAAARRFR